MYLNYYLMRREPFHVTPDPAFLYFSPSHKEALASVVYGMQARKGFIAVTGEVGCGKTTLVRSILNRIDRERFKVIYVFYPNISLDDLLSTIFEEMGKERT